MQDTRQIVLPIRTSGLSESLTTRLTEGSLAIAIVLLKEIQ